MAYDKEVDDFLLGGDEEDSVKSKKDKSLNLLALCRRVPECASVYLPDDGKVLISMDLSGAEPNMMLNFTKDEMLKFFLKEAAGVDPYWSGKTLMTDSMYITFASRNLVGDQLIKKCWEKDWEGMSFSQQYLKDSDVVKKYLDKQNKAYSMYKMLVLALFYGLGAQGVVRQIGDYGITLTEEQGKDIHSDFWKLFSGVNSFQLTLRKLLKHHDYITNPFGFKLNVEPHKVLNAYIQSSVSSFLSVLLIELDKYPKAEYIATIHDELVYSLYPEDIPDFLEFRDLKLKDLNDSLKFEWPLELGMVVGRNFYEAK